MTSLIDLSEEQRMIHETLERAAREANDFQERRKRLQGATPNRMALWSGMAELGALGLCFTEDRGGFGGTPRDMALLPSAIAAALPVEPLIATGITAARLLGAANAPVEALIAGEDVVIPALFENAGVFGPPRLLAQQEGESWTLSGRKPAVRHGDVAQSFLVSARAGNGETVLALCAADAEGLDAAPFRLIDGAGAADLTFAGTPARVVLQGKPADAAITDALDWTLTALCVEATALCEAANRDTFAYLKERRQFGQPLARFQGLQFTAADMHVAATEAAAATDAALLALAGPAGSARTARILSASLTADRAGRVCAHSAVQLHGGMGVSDELIISHYARRLAAIRAQIGTTEARAAHLETLTEGACA